MTSACFLLLSATILGQAETKPAIPTVAELIAKIPVLDSAKDRARNLELVGRMKDDEEMDLKFRAVYRATGESSFLLCDGSDNTPLMFVAGRQMLLYDPVGPVVYRSNSTTFVIGSETHGDQSTFLMGISTEKKPGRIYFDLRNLPKTHAESEEVAHTGGTTYRLTRMMGEGAREVYHFDLSRPCPVTRIEMFEKDAKEPNGYFDIALDGTIKDDEFAFPDEKTISKIISVKTLPANSFLATAGGLFASMRACYVRMAAHHPAARNSLKFPGLLGINWSQVEQNDTKYAGAMRNLIPKAARDGLTPDASRAEVFQVRPEDLFAPRLLGETAGSPRP